MKGVAKRKLTEEQVLHILRSPDSHRRLALECGVAPSAIQKLRQGKSYVGVCPDEPRLSYGATRKGPTCRDCVHYSRDRCTMGFPEFDEIGGRAACTCVTYRSALS